MRKSTIVSLLLLALVIAGCGKTEASASRPKVVSAQVTADSCDPSMPGAKCKSPSAAAAASTVAKIIFVGKEHACDCTRKRVESAWAALQKALGKSKVPVEKVQIDTEGDKITSYRQQREMMALPAIYFLNAKNEVVELLQGEVTAEQIAKALGPMKEVPGRTSELTGPISHLRRPPAKIGPVNRLDLNSVRD